MPDPLQEALNPTDPNAFDPHAEEQGAAASQPAAPSEPVAAGPPVSDKPRNPDGTFKATSPHPAGLRQRARDLLYLEDDQINALDPATLNHLVIGAQQRLLDEHRHIQQQRIVTDTSPQAPPAPPAPPAPDTLDLGTDADGNPVNEADLHPALVRTLKAQQKTIRELQNTAKQINDRDVDRQHRATRDMLDTAFDTLPEAARAHVGSGGFPDLSEDERAVRNMILAGAGVDLAKDSQVAISRKVKAAYERIAQRFGGAKAAQPGYDIEAPTPQPKAKAKPTVDDWNDGAIAKPTNRVANEKPLGRDRAIENLARKLAWQTAPVRDAAEINGISE